MAVVLVANSILLVSATVLLAWLAASSFDVKKTLKEGLERLNNGFAEKRLLKELKRYKRSTPVQMSFLERIELEWIDKSNIRHLIPFMDLHVLALVCLLIFIAAFGPIYRILVFVPSAAVISFLFSLLPVFILDIMGRYNSEKIRRKLAEFISILNRWCAVKEDIFYAFEKSVDSDIGMPLKVFVRDMVIQVERGIGPMEALDMLMMKVGNAQFMDFIVNIKQNIRHRGDIRKLLDNLENQFYKIEEEYNRRKISTYKDRILTYAVMFFVLFIGYFFLQSNPDIKEFYLGTLEGKLLLTLFCILYAGGFTLSFRIMKFNY